ncbi:hypothetical protein BC629DRAFT_1173486 [Irpex lacteus]|nr:hypothetical protein BC629DRAFT_1173486 [Irpex lacteus]
MIIFSSSIVTSIVSLVHAALILTIGGTDVVIAALVEDTFSLIVCNIPVVVTFLLRHKFRFGDSEARRGTGEDGTSTFGWWKARTVGSGHLTTGGYGARSGITVLRTVESDTAMDVATINLWELSTNGGTLGSRDRAGDVGLVSGRERAFARSQIDRVDEEELQDDKKGEHGVAWLTPETFHHPNKKMQEDSDDNESYTR